MDRFHGDSSVELAYLTMGEPLGEVRLGRRTPASPVRRIRWASQPFLAGRRTTHRILITRRSPRDRLKDDDRVARPGVGAVLPDRWHTSTGSMPRDRKRR